MKKIAFVVLLCWFQSIVWASTDAVSSSRIVGGEKAPSWAYPWAVVLMQSSVSDPFSAQFCGGSLIRADVVLTAAHCVDDITDVASVNVAVGVSRLSSITPNQRISIQSIVLHPDYDNVDVPRNDIALLRLTRSVSTPIVPLVDTVLMNEIIGGLKEMTVLGWGALDNSDSPNFPQDLQHVRLPYVNLSTCNAALDKSVTENMFCAGFASGGKDSCQGDSGGPIVHFDASDVPSQVGIVSWGQGCAESNQYGVYTRLLNYLMWVETTMSGPYVAERMDAGYLGQGQSTSISIPVDNWGSSQSFNVVNAEVQYGSFIKTIKHNCVSVGVRGQCFVDLSLLSEEATTLNGRISISFSSGQVKTIDINGEVLPTVDANVRLGTNAWAWFSGGDRPWQAGWDNGRTTYQSGAIRSNQSSVILTYINGPGTLTFDWQVSSEAGYDFADVYVGSRRVSRMSGEQVWQGGSVVVEAGRQAVSWRYVKDNYKAVNLDRADLDNVVWTPSLPNTSLGGGGSLTFGWFLMGGLCLSLRYGMKGRV